MNTTKQTILLILIVGAISVFAKHQQYSYLKEHNAKNISKSIGVNTLFASGYELNATLKSKTFPTNNLYVLYTSANGTNLITVNSTNKCGTKINKRCLSTYLYGTDITGKQWIINTVGYF